MIEGWIDDLGLYSHFKNILVILGKFIVGEREMHG